MITIDQHKINNSTVKSGPFPRGQDWWSRFIPEWGTPTVHEDGTVTIEVSSEPGGGQPPKPAAVIRRHRELAMLKWLQNLPQLEPAIVEDAGERCQCWRQPARLHNGHCCFDGAKPVRICHSMPEDMRKPA